MSLSKLDGKTMNEGLIIDGLRCSLSLGKTSLGAKSEIKKFEILSPHQRFGLFGPRFPKLLKATKILKLVLLNSLLVSKHA